MTRDVPAHLLAPYIEEARTVRERVAADPDQPDLLRALHDQFEEHGFELVPYDVELEYARTVRPSWSARMEF